MNNTELSILIIEDDSLFCEKLKNDLMQFSSNINTCNSAENGSHFVALNKPTLIFLDNQLPRLQGNQVITFYKELSPSSKVILISGNFEMREVVLAIENKADYILDKKNITRDTLKETIAVLTQEKNKKLSLWGLLGSFMVPWKKQLKVAIVEDDELFALKLTKELESLLPNYKINSFLKGGSFFQYCQDNSPEILLLDYFLPDYSGSEILDIIRQVLPEVKVIILSAQNDSDVAISLFQKGISGYIVKSTGWTQRLEECINDLKFKE